MTNKKLDILLSEYVGPDNWATFSDVEKQRIYKHYESNPAEIEKVLTSVMPDMLSAIETGTPLSAMKPMLDQGALDKFQPQTDPGFTGRLAGYISGQGVGIGDVITGTPRRVLMGAAEGLTGAAHVAGWSSPYEAVKEAQAYSDPYLTGTERSIAGGLQSVGQNLGLAAGALGVGTLAGVSPIAAVSLGAPAAMGVLKGGQVGAQHVDQGGGRLAAVAKGAASAAAEFAGGTIAVKMGFSPTGQFQAMPFMLAKQVEEQAVTVMDTTLDVAFQTGQPVKSFGEALSRQAQTAVQVAWTTPILSFGMGMLPVSTMQKKYYQNKFVAAPTTKQQTNFAKSGIEAGAVEIMDDGEITAPAPVLSVTEQLGDMVKTLEQARITPGAEVETVADADTPVFNVGDEVRIPARVDSRMPGSATLADQTLRGTVEQITPEGNLQVRLETGSVQTFSPDQTVQARPGTLGSLEAGHNNIVSTTGLTRMTKEIMRQLRGVAQTGILKNINVYASVMIDGQMRPAKINVDWALQADPEVAASVLSHELGHILDNLDEASRIKGGLKVPVKGVLKTLMTEYTALKETVFRDSPIDEPRFRSALEQFEEQEQQIRQKFAEAGVTNPDKNVDFIKARHKAWKQMLKKSGNSMIDQSRRQEIRQQSYEMARAEAQNPSEIKSIQQRIYSDLMVEEAQQRGAARLPAIISELEKVSMIRRGYRDLTAYKAGLKQQAGKNYNAELFADFFSAWLNDSHILNEVGDKVRMIEHLAPTVSEALQGHFDVNPRLVGLLGENLTVEYNQEHYLQAMKENEAKYQAAQAERTPRNAQLRKIAYDMLPRPIATRLMNMFMDKHFAAREAMSSDLAREVMRDKGEELQNMSAHVAAIMHEVYNSIEPLFTILRDAGVGKTITDLEAQFSDYMNLRRIEEDGRIKNIRYTTKDAFGNKITEVRRVPLLTGDYGTREDAIKRLNETPVYQQHREAFEAAFQGFQQVWQEMVVSRLEQSGLLSDEVVKQFKENPAYSYYGVFHEVQKSQSAFANAPKAVQEMFGTLENPRLTLSATLEHAVNLSFLADLNNYKRFLAQNVREGLGRDAERRADGTFKEPADSHNEALVVFRDNGEQKGVIVPSPLVDGINYTRDRTIAEMHAWMMPMNQYFRNLYTTWSLPFITNNLLRDFQSMWYNARNPETDGWGWGILLEHMKVVRDTFWEMRGDPESVAAGNAELLQLYKERLVLADEDYSQRYNERNETSLQSMQKTFNKEWADWLKPETQNQVTQSLLGIEALTNNTFARGLKWLAGKTEYVTKTTDRMTKRTAARYYRPFLDRGKITREQYNHLVRNVSGPPNFLTKGTFTPFINTLYMFFNPKMQGMYRDMHSIYDAPKPVLTKRALGVASTLAFQSAFISFMVKLGGAGEEWANLFEGIPQFDQDTAICIPFGKNYRGEVTYSKIPLDPTTAMFKRMFMTMWEAPQSTMPEVMANLVKAAGTPATTLADNTFMPVWALIGDALKWSSGNPPINQMTGNPIIPKHLWDAGGFEAAKYYAKYFMNQASPLAPIFKFPMGERDGEGRQMEASVHDALAIGLDLPLLQPFIRMLTVKQSAGGYRDARRRLNEADQQAKARAVTKLRPLLKHALKNGQPLDPQAIRDILEGETGNADQLQVAQVLMTLQNMSQEIGQRLYLTTEQRELLNMSKPNILRSLEEQQ